MANRSLHAIVLVVAVAFPAVAGAWDQVTTVASALPSDFIPSNTSPIEPSGYWVAGGAASLPLLVRYDNAGAIQVIRYPQSVAATTYLAVEAEIDGGAVVAETHYGILSNCLFQRYDAGGNLRWANRSLPSGGTYACDTFHVDGGGGAWVRHGNTFYHLAFADGAVDASVVLDGEDVHDFAADPKGPNVYVATGNLPVYDSSARAAIEKISSVGGRVWHWAAPQEPGQPSLLTSLAINSSGDVLGFGSIGTDPNYVLYAVDLSSAGAAKWVRSYPGYGAAGAVAASINSAYVVASQAGAQTGESLIRLVRFDGAGILTWTAALATSTPGASCYAGPVRAAPATADAVVAISCTFQNGLEIARFSPAGAKIASRPTQLSVLLDLQVLADGSSMAIVHPNSTQLPDGTYQFSLPFFEHDGANGATLPAPQLAATIPATDGLSNAVFGPDGSAYLLSTNGTTRQYTLDRIAPDGTVLWRSAGTGAWSQGTLTSIVLVGQSVCLAGMLDADVVVACRATTSGQPGATIVLNQGLAPTNLQMTAHAVGAGELEVIYVESDFAQNRLVTHLTLVDTSGTVIHDLQPLMPGENLAGASIDASGDALVLTSPTNYIRFAADGTRRYSKTFNVTGASLLQPFLTDDGSALLLYSGDGVHLVRLDATGAPSWTQTLPAPPGNSAYRYDYVPSIVSTANDLFLSLSFRDLGYAAAIGQPFPAFIARLGLADGALRWSTTIPGILFNYPRLALDPVSTRLLAVSGWPNKIREQLLDAATGNTVADRFDACEADSCIVYNSSVAGDGVLRVAVDTSTVTSGSLRRILAQRQPFATPGSIHIGQAGLDGAWFATYEGGQGFTLDYIASASTIFMPWFTFAQTSVNNPSDLAWYALQGGGIGPADTSAAMAIAVSSPGAFNNGNVPGRQVGMAHLSFSDCNDGTLLYQFDADTNNGAGGLITLTRLTPSADPCHLADGSTVAAQSTNLPANGFDARQSGSWFDPATGGQGLEITIVPSGNGSAGLIFVPWFTYDPAGHGDDALNQHWFTLQGDLSKAVNGKVTLPIYRIIGGTFDAMPTSNFSEVGHATLTMSGCDTAQLDYQFDTTEVAHAFAGLSGTSHLIKIGGCTAP